jgi:KUP system potassium uptake protein
LRGLSRPYASDEEKFEIKKTTLSNCYRMIVRYGYNDIVVTEGLGNLVFEKLKEYISTTPLRGQLPESLAGVSSALPGSSSSAADRSLSSSDEDRKARRLAVLEEAYAAQTVYVSTFHFMFLFIV